MAYSTIRKGTSNEDVKTWQDFLKSQNYNIAADGIFGNETDNATRDWQTKNGLTVDGIVGKNTWASMNIGNNTNTANTNNTPKITAPKGVDQAVWDEVTSTYTPDDKLTDLKNEADSTYDSAKELMSQENIIDPNLKEAYNQKFEVSDSYNQAMGYVTGKLEELMAGKNQFTDRYHQSIDDYLKRDPFEYDVDNDQLFQQALASAMNSGKTAMQDTIGQASALTGGYGSTYATTAGNQAYNQFIEDAYNNLPEYYQMALEAYQAEGQEMVNRINILGDAEANDFQKTYTQWSAAFDNANQIWNKDFQTWDANVNQAFNAANLQLGEYGQRVENIVNLHEMATNRYETEYAKDYQGWADKISQFTGIANTQQSDYWQNETYEQTERWNQKDLDYKYANLSLDREKFNYSKGDTNNDGVVDKEEKKIKEAENYKAPTQTQKQGALKAYNEGGQAAYEEYLDSLPNDVDVEEIDLYIHGKGKEGDKDYVKGYGVLPYDQRTYTVVDDGGVNGFWGIDNNAVVKDQYENEFTLKQLNKYAPEIAKELSKAKYTKGSTYTKK